MIKRNRLPQGAPALFLHERHQLVGVCSLVVANEQLSKCLHVCLGHDEQTASLRNEVVVGIDYGRAFVSVQENLPFHTGYRKLNGCIDAGFPGINDFS